MRYRVFGYITSSFGLAVACRNTIQGLLASGRQAELIDIDPGGSHQGKDGTHRDDLTSAPTGVPATNVFHMNPLEVLELQSQWTRWTTGSDRANVCVPFWELPRLPAPWVPILNAMDAVLAPTRFIAETCQRDLSCPVWHYPQAVFLPEDISSDRARWGLPEDACVFLQVFDPSSDIERKNPWAAVNAFTEAFVAGDDVLLVIHLHAWSSDPAQVAQVEALKTLAAEHRTIMVLTEHLSYRDVLSLYASCDVVVSLHRSEGLGLPLMEAMSLGRVALATGWSGNVDFMTEENSCLVGHAMTPVNSQHPAYASEIGRDGQVWAEPDRADAVAQMRRLASDPALRKQLGQQAAADMESRRQHLLSGRLFDDLEAFIGEHVSAPPRSPKQLRRVLRTDTAARRYRAFKRRVVLTLRALRLYPQGD